MLFSEIMKEEAKKRKKKQEELFASPITKIKTNSGTQEGTMPKKEIIMPPKARDIKPKSNSYMYNQKSNVPQLPQVKSAVSDVKKFVKNDSNALKSSGTPMRNSSGNLTTKKRDMSKDAIVSGDDLKKGQSVGDKIVGGVYDITHNKLPKQSKAFVTGTSEVFSNPIQRAAYEIKQAFGIKDRSVYNHGSTGEYLSLMGKYNKSKEGGEKLTDKEFERLNFLANEEDRTKRQYVGLRINGTDDDWKQVQTAEQLGNFSGEMFKLWIGGEIFGSIAAGTGLASNTGKIGKTIEGILASTANFATSGAISAYGQGASGNQIAKETIRSGALGATSGIISNVVRAGGTKLLSRAGISTDLIFGNQAARIGLNLGSNVAGMTAGTYVSSKITGDEATLNDYLSAAMMALAFGIYGEFKTQMSINPETGKTMFSTIREARAFSNNKIESLKTQSLQKAEGLFRKYISQPNETTYNDLVNHINSEIKGIEKIFAANASGTEFITSKGGKALKSLYQDYLIFKKALPSNNTNSFIGSNGAKMPPTTVKNTNVIMPPTAEEYKAMTEKNVKFPPKALPKENNTSEVIKPDLIAVHNLGTEQLIDALERGQFSMPSIAVTNKNHTDFGDISIVFNKDTIDPSRNAHNKLYGADAWTPTQTRLKKNPIFDDGAVSRLLYDFKTTIGRGNTQLINFDTASFKETIAKADGSIYGAYANDIGMQTVYALKNGLITTLPTTSDGSVNSSMLQKRLNSSLDNDAEWRKYKQWIETISDEVIISYDKATNEDIINNMKLQPDTAKTFRLTESGELTVPAKEYGSIDEYRKNKGRLIENAESEVKATGQSFISWANDVRAETSHSISAIVEAINHAYINRYNINDIINTFSEHGIDLSLKKASMLQELYKQAVELPTKYFEAKPQRGVGTNEIAMVVLPDTAANESLKTLLESKAIPYKMYEAGSEDSRINAIKSLERVWFSRKNNEGLTNHNDNDIINTDNEYYQRSEKDVEQQGRDNGNSKEQGRNVVESSNTIRSESNQFEFEGRPKNESGGWDKVYGRVRGSAKKTDRKYIKSYNSIITFEEYENIPTVSKYFKNNYNRDVHFAKGEIYNISDFDKDADPFAAEGMYVGGNIIASLNKNTETIVLHEMIHEDQDSPAYTNVVAEMSNLFDRKPYDEFVMKKRATYAKVFENRSEFDEDIAKEVNADIISILATKEGISAENIRRLFPNVQNYEKARDLAIKYKIYLVNNPIEHKFVLPIEGTFTNNGKKYFSIPEKTYSAEMSNIKFSNVSENSYSNMSDDEITALISELNSKGARSVTENETLTNLLYEKFGKDAGEYQTLRHDIVDPIYGVKTNGSIENTVNQLIAGEKYLYNLKREASKIKAALSPTTKQMEYIDKIAKGEATLEDFSPAMGLSKFEKLIDIKTRVYEAENGGIKKFKETSRNHFRSFVEEFIRDSKNWKDKWALVWQINTPERNAYDTMGKDADTFIDNFITPMKQNEAQRLRYINEIKEKLASLQLSDDEFRLTMRYGEGLEIDAPEKIKHAAKVFNEVAEQIKNDVNAVLVLNGYKSIDNPKINLNVNELKDAIRVLNGDADIFNITSNKIRQFINIAKRYGIDSIDYDSKGKITASVNIPYFPHGEVLNSLQSVKKALGFSNEVTELPGEITGITENFKPNKKWVGHLEKRRGKKTDYDIRLWDNYINNISEVIYHTSDITKLRLLESGLRSKYSQSAIDEEAKAARYMMTNEELDDLFAGLRDKTEDLTKHNNLINWLNEYANLIAGKKHSFDRNMERYVLGRKFYNVMTNFENNWAGNQVGGNVSSIINQFSQMTNLMAEKNPIDIITALNTMMFGDKTVLDESDFITTRDGAIKLKESTIEKLASALFKAPMAAEGFTSRLVWQTAYNEAIRNGKSIKDAKADADKYSAQIMADRTKIGAPTIFASKNPLVKIFTTFQIEPANMFFHYVKDLPREKKARGFMWSLKTAVATVVMKWLFNEGKELLTGIDNKVDIDLADLAIKVYQYIADEEGVELGDVLESAGENVANLPFMQTPMTLLGFDNVGQIPMSNMVPNIPDIVKKFNKGKYGQAAWDVADTVINPFNPFGGYSQAKKTIRGLRTVAKGGEYDSSGNLMYPVEQSAENYVKGILFGKYALPESREYWDNDKDTLTANETKEYEYRVQNGENAQEVYDEIYQRKTESSEKSAANKAYNDKVSGLVKNIDYGLELELDKIHQEYKKFDSSATSLDVPKANKSFKFKGFEYELTAEECATLQNMYNDEYFKAVNIVTDSAMSNKEKYKLISECRKSVQEYVKERFYSEYINPRYRGKYDYEFKGSENRKGNYNSANDDNELTLEKMFGGKSNSRVIENTGKQPQTNDTSNLTLEEMFGKQNNKISFKNYNVTNYNDGKHKGMDFAVPDGTPIQSTVPGTVVVAESLKDSYGNYVVIKDASGNFHYYAHLGGYNVNVGDKVGRGTTIGVSGNSGKSTGPHLHYEVRKGNDYSAQVDPRNYL